MNGSKSEVEEFCQQGQSAEKIFLGQYNNQCREYRSQAERECHATFVRASHIRRPTCELQGKLKDAEVRCSWVIGRVSGCNSRFIESQLIPSWRRGQSWFSHRSDIACLRLSFANSLGLASLINSVQDPEHNVKQFSFVCGSVARGSLPGKFNFSKLEDVRRCLEVLPESLASFETLD
jgi:hypothetical protein